MAHKKQKTDIDKLSFEEAIKELTNIVGNIEQGEIPLQDSLEQYEKGMALIKQCRTILQEAEERIEKITKEQDQDSKEGGPDEKDPDELFK
ncbi:exodeoxyribonuclease VII small subunit [Planctomycetota bacterium]